MKKLLGFCLVGLWAFTVQAGAPLLLDWGQIDTSAAARQTATRAIRSAATAPTVQNLSASGTAPWLVQFNDVIREEWKAELEAAGAKLKGYIPENAYLVEATPAQITAIAALANVAYVGEFLPDYKRAAKVRAKLARVATAKEVDSASPCRILLFSSDDLDAVAQRIEALTGAAVTVAAGDRIRADLTAAQVQDITGWGEVQWIESYSKPRLWNNVAVQTNKMNVSNVWTTLGLTGAGQTIAVCDTGLDTGDTGTLHRDFTNRVTGFGWSNGAYSASYSWADFDAHGSHVCGSVLGNGTMSTGLYKGVAYEANLIIQGSQEDLSGIPTALSTLFKQAYDNGARIHSDSWGYDDHGYYNDDSRAVDQYVWSNKTMLICIAAGNSGTDSNTVDGVIDLESVASPATAKNCLTVGAGENYRTTGGYSSYTWGTAWPGDYDTVPISTDYLSRAASGVDAMAAFSSRGPCNDGRIKPDIVAPGTDIISTRSRKASGTGWGVAGNTNYLYEGGTSMATPLTAGAAGLTRQWVMTTGGVTNPSGQLLKALMLNGARNMAPGQYGTGTKQEIPNVRPNNVEGWGHVDLFTTLQPATNQFLALIDTNSLATGQTNTFTYTVTTGSTNKFILTMAYADYWGTAGSGKQLINDLDLTVQKPSGSNLYANGRTSKDATNNVEMIEFAADEAGTYTVRVSARTVPSGGTQAYALVVRGPKADETPTAPVFGANPGPVSTTAGVAVAFTVSTTAGYPTPVLALQSTTASSGYTFTAASGQLNYTPPTNDIGTNTFTFTATNASGAATQTVSVVVYQAPPLAPASIWASATNTTDFTAAWSASSGATSYRLDVATNSNFSGGGGAGGTLIDEDFTDFSDWTDSGTASDTTHAGAASPCRSLGAGASLTSPSVNYPTQMTFYVDASSGGNGKVTTNYYSLDGGASWTPLGTFTVSTAGATETQVMTSSPNLSGSTGVMFRFVSAFSTWYLDDVKVTGGSAGSPSYVAGYSNLTVAGTSQSVTGLTSGATYYFRARAVNGSGTSSNSPTASVTTTVSSVAPAFGANPGPVFTTSGVAVAFTVSASGTPTPTLALQYTSASSGYSFTPATGQLTYTPPQADGGTTRLFRITASNSAGVATQTVSVVVTAGTAPSFTGGAGPYSTTTGVAVAFTVSASGTPPAALALQGTTASSGYSFTPATGQLYYTPPTNDIGSRTFTFTASNVAGVVTQVTSVGVSDLPATAPQFGANPGPVGATTSVAVAFTVVTTNGYPTPVLALLNTTASGGYSFTPATGQLTYTPPETDAGTQFFMFTASNSAGVASQTVSVVVTAGIPGAPASIWASTTNSSGFTAVWSAVLNATSYRLDVGTNATFTGGGGAGGQFLLASNVASSAAAITNDWSGYQLAGTAYVIMTNSASVITSPAFSTVGFTNLTVDFRARSFGTVAGTTRTNITISISTNDGVDWIVVGVVAPTNNTLQPQSTLTNVANLGSSMTRIRWQTLSAASGGGVGVSNLVVLGWTSGSSAPAYVPGYSNLTVAGTSQAVTGLTENTMYYFRARAANASGTGANSSVASVTTTSNAPAGTPPVMNTVVSQAALTGRDVTRTVTATQTDGDPILSFACTTGVDAATWDFDTGTGDFLFVPTAAQIGANVFSFTAADKDGTSSPVAMTVTVSAASAPTMTAIPAQVANVGVLFDYTVGATEPDGDAVTFACTSTVDEATWAMDTNGYFLFEPTTAQIGTNTFSFTATDRDGASAPALMSVKVYSAAATNDFTQWVEDREEDPADSNFYGNADFDRDGQTTYEEYVADTDPAASNSVLRLTGNYYIAARVSNTTGQIQFSFPASTIRYYQLEYCTDITNHTSVVVSNLGWGVPGMTVTNNSTGTWYGVIRALLQSP